jgi:hypothetical protein
MSIDCFPRHLAPLPSGKTVVDVISDFYSYLLSCTKDYLKDTHPVDGQSLWSSVEDDIHYVLSHPNGWEGIQQAKLREAAVKAGLVREADSNDRVSFVTEGEASLNFCLRNGLGTNALKVRLL